MFVLFHGPDEFSAREALTRLRATHDFAFNQDTFPGAETDLASIRTTCDTMPFLSEHRLVVVEELPRRRRATKGDAEEDASEEGGQARPTATESAGRSTGKGKQGKGASGPDPKAFAAGLVEYIPHLPSFTVLVLLLGEQLDGSDPLVRAAQRYGQAQIFLPPKGARLEEWLTHRAEHAGARLAPEAARLLMIEVGDDLRVLANEIEKLSVYVGRGGTIEPADVRALTPSSRQAKVFDLTDALARRDRPRALTLLHELLAAGESPLGIVALTAYQTRTLLTVKSLAERGLRAPQIAQTAGLAPFVAEKSLTLARQFSLSQLESAHRLLLEMDTALKRSRMTPELALDLLAVEFGGIAR
jgi:DNA polymerase-3 subunit delta